ncbi:MAG: FAD-dependent oxidoreductase [Pyrinomonadaceae bacterium]|nr:FAD-dependent oxidoreductase [Phycisphaerales bacterium]
MTIMEQERYDVIVVGAGIIGASCAYSLAMAGQRVLVVDSRPIGSLTSSKGMGHVTAMEESQPQLELTRYSRRLWNELGPRLPAEADYFPCGTIWVAETRQEMMLAEEKHDRFVGADVGATVLSRAALEKLEPNVRPGMAGGLLVPADCVVFPPRVAQWLLEQAQLRGTRMMIGFEVAAIEPGGVQLKNRLRFQAPAVVNAAGIFSPTLTAGLPVRWRKGHIVVTAPSPGFCHHQLVELGYLQHAHKHDADSIAFNIEPRGNGQMLIGSSRQYGSTSDDVEPEVLDRMMRRACEFMPGIPSLRVALTRTGFRPASPDSLPIIGECPKQPGVFVASGHEGLGITTSLGTGQIVADLVMGTKTEIDVGAFSPARFHALGGVA